MTVLFDPVDWWALLVHCSSLSLLAVGGAMTTAPDMYRFVIEKNHWITPSQFSASIALGQAAPGPNVLFLALVGWHIGLNASNAALPSSSAILAALGGVSVVMLGIIVPSSVLAYTATQWAYRNREQRAVKAFKAGMAPIVVALMVSTGFLLTSAHNQPKTDFPLWILTAITTLLVWKTQIHLLWLLACGAILGALGWL